MSESTKRIVPGKPFFHLGLAELWDYRYMLYYSIRRDVVVLYKQTILGPVWVVLQPFFMSVLFSIVFRKIAGVSTEGIPAFLFYFSNNIFWGMLAMSYTNISTIFVSQKVVMSRVYFPRLIPPLASLGGTLIRLVINTVFLSVLYLYFIYKGEIEFQPSFKILLLGPVVFQLSLCSMGFGLLFACLTLKYRDLSVVGSLFVQGWMYLSPIAYPLSVVPQQYQNLFALNPVASALELSRFALFPYDAPAASVLVIGWSVTIFVFLLGLFVFNVVQRKFVDIV